MTLHFQMFPKSLHYQKFLLCQMNLRYQQFPMSHHYQKFIGNCW